MLLWLTRVTKGAISKAASIAAMVLCTQALATGIPDEEPAQRRSCLSTGAGQHQQARLAVGGVSPQ